MKKIESLLAHTKRHLLTLAFVFGFILDNLTLNRVDQAFDNFVLTFYIILAMASMIALYAGTAGRMSDRMNLFFKEKSPVAIQYAFGGLLSGMLIFYGRSGAFYESWPYIVVILFVIYGNETIKDRASRLVYNLAMFFIGMFSYVVLVVPVILGKMGALIFVGSGFLALIIMYWFFKLLTYIVPNFIALQRRNVVFVIGLIYVLFNALYFTNIIPPIPLSLKDIGIYHSVIRFENDQYQLTYEKPKWWEFFRDSDKNFHAESGDNIYCFTSVFAPSRLSTNIYHKWEFYNEAEQAWVEHGRFPYAIAGGRNEGFRGYTQISNFEEGRWRCTVETERGQSLGRETFMVTYGPHSEFVVRTR